MVATTSVFDFLEQQGECTILRYEISCPVFSRLRVCLRRMIESLGEADDRESTNFSTALRILLSELLTTPMAYTDELLARLEGMGSPASIAQRWGTDVRQDFESATLAITELSQNENLLRAKLVTVFERLRAEDADFRLYCHRAAARHFSSLPGAPDPGRFIHSVAQYRQQPTFDALIKVGPLRSRGWGRVPDALLSAPRFATLHQLVWTACGDEEDFGYDPAAPSSAGTLQKRNLPSSSIAWSRDLIRIGEPSTFSMESDVDELAWFANARKTEDELRAILVQINDEQGILYAPRARILSYDPFVSGDESLEERLPLETLCPGMFVAEPILSDVDLGSDRATNGKLGDIWKKALSLAMESSPLLLITVLQQRGLALAGLWGCLQRWKRPATSVVHAPQRRVHFEKLLHVLAEQGFLPDAMKASRWKQAWAEIKRSRSKAIQAGVEEHRIVDETLLDILRHCEPEIREWSVFGESFEFDLPAHAELQGTVYFHRVLAVEEGFVTPRQELNSLHELSEVEQWRG